jgi:hypothetical protein
MATHNHSKHLIEEVQKAIDASKEKFENDTEYLRFE